jgi:hypothetical protein
MVSAKSDKRFVDAIKNDPALHKAAVDQMFLGSVMRGAGHPVSKPVRVFRLEMANGNGPYNSGLPNSHEIYEKICDCDPGFFCVRNAILNREQCGVTDRAFHEAHGHSNYACDSLESLKDWFPDKAREYLAQFGAKIVEYEIPVGEYMEKVGCGEVIFNRHKCRKLRELDAVQPEELAHAA